MVNVVHLRKVFLSHVSGVKEFSCENFEYAPESTYSIVCKVHLDFFKNIFYLIQMLVEGQNVSFFNTYLFFSLDQNEFSNI